MAYAEHVNVPNLHSLVDLVAQFAGANGWTVERNTLSATNRTVTLRIPGVSDYVHLFNTDQTILRSRLSIGYSAAAVPGAQPLPSPRDALSNVLAGPYPRVKLFSNGNAIHVAMATTTAGEYRHHAFGVLSKAGDYVGGTYTDGTWWGSIGTSYSGMVAAAGDNVVLFGHNTDTDGCGHVRADSTEDVRSNSYQRLCSDFAGTLLAEGQAGTSIGTLYQAGPNYDGLRDTFWLARALGGSDENIFSGRSILQPVQVSIRRAGTTPYLSPIGTVSGLQVCYLEKLEPEQEVTIGGETWVVFPWLRKLAMSGSFGAPPASGNYGWAVRKS